MEALLLIKAVIGIIITASIVITTRQIIVPPKPVLLYNPSQSAAIGWYRLQSKVPIERGSQVAAYAPEWARIMADERQYLPYDYPLIKKVWAVAGEEVCYHNSSVSVPKRPDIPVLGQDDSRYFGPVGREKILGRVKYLGNLKNKESAENVDFSGFGG